jgi:CRISPR-associated endonuclease/helicase Cas3
VIGLCDYWRQACQRATEAIALAGLVPAQPTQAKFSALFPNYNPTPTQELADKIDIRGQSLIIIEDTTGSGKTEAADVLASRMLGTTAHRLIFALPTTATADGIAERHAESHAQQSPGVALRHRPGSAYRF